MHQPSRQTAGGPGPLQVEAPAVAVDIQHLAAGVEPRHQAALHGSGVKFPGAQAPGGDLGLVKAAGAGDGQGKLPHLAAQGLQLPVRQLRYRLPAGYARRLAQHPPQPGMDAAGQQRPGLLPR